MEQFISTLESEDVTSVAISLIAGVTAVMVLVPLILAHAWRKVRERQLGAALLQDMLVQNMTTKEIETVMSVWNDGNLSSDELVGLKKAQLRAERQLHANKKKAPASPIA